MGVLSVSLPAPFTLCVHIYCVYIYWSYCVHVFCISYSLVGASTGVHKMCTCPSERMHDNNAMKALQRFYPVPAILFATLPLLHSCSPSVTLSHGLIWGRTQFLNSTPWVLLIRASLAAVRPQRGTQRARRMAENRIPQDNEVHL